MDIVTKDHRYDVESWNQNFHTSGRHETSKILTADQSTNSALSVAVESFARFEGRPLVACEGAARAIAKGFAVDKEIHFYK